MSEKFDSIKKRIEEVQGRNQRDYNRGQELLKFVDSCKKMMYLIAEHRSAAILQQASDSNAKIAERLKPLVLHLEIIEDIISELSWLNDDELSEVQKKLDAIGG